MPAYKISYNEQVFLKNVRSSNHIPTHVVLAPFSVAQLIKDAQQAIDALARYEAIIADSSNTIEANIARNIAQSNLARAQREARNARAQIDSLKSSNKSVIYKIASEHWSESNATKAAARINGVVTKVEVIR